MKDRNELLRMIPKMDALIDSDEAKRLTAEFSGDEVTDALRSAVDEARRDILALGCDEPTRERILERAGRLLGAKRAKRQRPVINATGVLLHTNLGRSLLPECAVRAAAKAALNYTNLEFDCSTGRRGDRYSHVEGLITELTGAESATVVNNNAAAVLLMLASLARGGEVIVSRGELVEIGGSFRVPEVMEQSGCTLREVGTTNKTHLADYERAVNDSTRALMKVHTSNYRITGFTEDASLEELSAVARAHGLPLLHDLGSGSLIPLSRFGLTDEPLASESIRRGANAVCFSGDKLLGGPQAGIIAGDRELVSSMKKHPLARALRVDKMTLAALEATFGLYRDEAQAIAALPLYRMLSAPVDELRARAMKLASLIGPMEGVTAEAVATLAEIGGGSAPGETVPSVALALTSENVGAERSHRALLMAETPIVARINEGRLIFDMISVPDSALERMAEEIRAALSIDPEDCE